MQAIKKKLKKATATHTGRIILLSIVLLLIAAVAGGIWYWNTHKKAFIKSKLVNAVNEKSKGLYQIKYDNLELDEIAGSLSVSNMSISYDSNKFNQLEKEEKAPPLLLKIQIPSISISGVKTPRALIDNEIAGRKIEIKNPVINIIYTHSKKDSARITPTKEVYEQLLGNLDLIQFDSVVITGAQITSSNLKTGKTNVQFMNISVSLVDVKVDSAGNADTTRHFFAKEIKIDCEKITWSAANRPYNYSIDSVSLSSVLRSADIKSFRIEPLLGEDAFVRSVPTQEDRFDFIVKNIHVGNIDLPELFDEKITADSMIIHSASFKIYRDLAIVRDTKNRVGTYPQQAIESIPLSLQLGKIVVTNGFLEYKERSAVTRQSGKVQFNNIYAAISNVTNDKAAVEKNNIMTAYISSRFLNATPFKVTWLFYLMNAKGRFDVKGTLGAMDATKLNKLSEPMGPARIERGYINGMEFDFKGHDYGMDGSVKLLYDDLNVTVLKKDGDTKELKKKKLLSLAANFLIKNSNPKKKEDVRVVQVHYDRDTNRSIFNMTWKSLFTGIKETVGIKPKK